MVTFKFNPQSHIINISCYALYQTFAGFQVPVFQAVCIFSVRIIRFPFWAEPTWKAACGARAKTPGWPASPFLTSQASCRKARSTG